MGGEKLAHLNEVELGAVQTELDLVDRGFDFGLRE
jgi:hypothetical protein